MLRQNSSKATPSLVQTSTRWGRRCTNCFRDANRSISTSRHLKIWGFRCPGRWRSSSFEPWEPGPKSDFPTPGRWAGGCGNCLDSTSAFRPSIASMISRRRSWTSSSGSWTPSSRTSCTTTATSATPRICLGTWIFSSSPWRLRPPSCCRWSRTPRGRPCTSMRSRAFSNRFPSGTCALWMRPRPRQSQDRPALRRGLRGIQGSQLADHVKGGSTESLSSRDWRGLGPGAATRRGIRLPIH